MKKFLQLLPLLVFGWFGMVNAQTLVEFDIESVTGFTASSLAPSFTAADVSATPITYASNLQPDNGFWENLHEGIFLVNWDAGSFNINNNYFEFTISADGGKELALSNLTLGVGRESTSGLSGPQTFRVYSSLDGYSTILQELVLPAATGGVRQATMSIDLPSEFNGIEEVTFRVHGHGDVVVGSFPPGGGLANMEPNVHPKGVPGGTFSSYEGTGSNVILTGTVFDPEELTLSTVGVSSLGETSVTFGASIPADGGLNITGRGFVYSQTSINSTPTIGGMGSTQISSGSGDGAFSQSISGLLELTQYTVRAYVITSEEGTMYSDPVTFATLAPELARFDIGSIDGFSASSLAPASFHSNLSVSTLTYASNLSIDTDYWEEALGSIILVGWQESFNTNQSFFEFTIEPDQDYRLTLNNITIGLGRETTNIGGNGPEIFRLYSNIDGFNQGDYIGELTIPEVSNRVMVQRVMSVLLDESYQDLEGPVTFRVYGYSGIDLGSDTNLLPGGGLANITTLNINDSDVSFDGIGSDLIISGTMIGPPSVATTPTQDEVEATSATLSGEVTSTGGSPIINRGIIWSTTEGFDPGEGFVEEMGDGLGEFSSTVSLLPFGTTIYYRAFAENSEGIAYGDEVSFQADDELILTLTGQEGWRLLTTPAGVPLSTFLGPIWTQGEGITGVDLSSGSPNIYTWDLDSDYLGETDDASPWWIAVPDLTTAILSAGQGLLVMVYEDDDISSPGVTGGFDKELPITGSEHASGVSPSLNSNEDGWSLIGNPFGSPVSWDGLSRTNVRNAIYVWEPNSDGGDGGQPDGQQSGSWITRSAGSGDFNGVIHPFQGFFVQSSGSNPSISFTQADKTTDVASFYGKEQTTQPLVRLELNGQGMSNSAWLRFSADGSQNFTDGDAWQLEPLSSGYALLATQKDAGLMDIGHYPMGQDLEIPLVTQATRPGSYKLKVTDIESNGLTLYLNDLETGHSLRLEQGMRYEFMIREAAKTPSNPMGMLQTGLQKQSSTGHRFIISTSKQLDINTGETPVKLTLNQNYPNPFNPTTQINFQLPESSQVRLTVYDMSGRQIATLVDGQVTAGSHSVNFDASNLSSGIYMYRLNTSNQMLMRKMTLIK
ncbi:MAG: T9SS type A sorting domain-containing protein [Balneolaceae bacterium]|nr:T9SS type A sorting domain-containing protein [Balneolaceae bacterium]